MLCFITTADAHTLAASSQLNWCSSISSKDEIWFLRMCHHISNAVYRHFVTTSHLQRSSSPRIPGTHTKADIMGMVWAVTGFQRTWYYSIVLVAHAGLGRGKDRKEVNLPSGCYEEQQSWNRRPLPGAGRKDMKKIWKGEREKRKWGMRNIVGRQIVWGWKDKCRGEDGLFVNREVGATGWSQRNESRLRRQKKTELPQSGEGVRRGKRACEGAMGGTSHLHQGEAWNHTYNKFLHITVGCILSSDC